MYMDKMANEWKSCFRTVDSSLARRLAGKVPPRRVLSMRSRSRKVQQPKSARKRSEEGGFKVILALARYDGSNNMPHCE